MPTATISPEHLTELRASQPHHCCCECEACSGVQDRPAPAAKDDHLATVDQAMDYALAPAGSFEPMARPLAISPGRLMAMLVLIYVVSGVLAIFFSLPK